MDDGERRRSGGQTAPEKDSFAIVAPSISLPKGGGAIRGIGEKFTANPVTGTGSMSVPIYTSPGRGGFGPKLVLSYDSGAGNGPFGFGWSLSIPAITRKTDKGLPRYRDGDAPDVFVLSGAEDLVPELKKDATGEWTQDAGHFVRDEGPRDGYLVRRYRPRIEGLFARIERWTSQTDPKDIYWRSISRDNVTTFYGRTDDSRIFDPADPTRIFSWLLCQSYDDKGNVIVYSYKAEDNTLVDATRPSERNRTIGANRHLKHVLYGNRESRLVKPDLTKAEWLFEVVFDYGEHGAGDPKPDDDERGEWICRHDPFSTYRAGFELRTYRLCQRVLMFHHFKDEDIGRDCLVRSTDFVYRDIRDNPDDRRKGHPTGAFIASVTQTGYKRPTAGGVYRKRSLPPLEFGYTEAKIQETIGEVDADSLDNLPLGLDGTGYQWVDLDGEGISGILTEQADTWFYKRNLGPISTVTGAGLVRSVATFAALERVAQKPAFAATGAGGWQLQDLAGAGRPDLVRFAGLTPGFFERKDHDQWDGFVPFRSLPNVNWRDPNLRFVDLTGDGLADLLITGDDGFTWYRSLGETGFAPSERTLPSLDDEAGPRLVFADGQQSIYLADLSGDGLTDLMRIRNGEVCYWPNLGYGRFGAKVTMDDAPWFDAPDQFAQQRIRLADVDGSGVIDIIYLGRHDITVYFNQSGNRWSAGTVIDQLPQVDDLTAVQVVDLFGNGTACLVWSSPLPGDARRPMRYLDLMGGQKPHLLVRTVNNLGAETRVQYAASTKFYLADKAAGTPWITRLPFPVHVVEKVTVTDKWRHTSFSSTSSYHHGYFDGAEREFRGFGRVEQVDVESFGAFAAGNVASPYITQDKTLYQPPVKTVTWFHTGAVLDRERILKLMVTEGPTFAAIFEGFSRAAEDVYGAFRAKYPEEKTFLEKMEPYEDKLRARKRDALVDYVVTHWPKPFADPSKLYEYFLIDVLLEGCARSSRVVAGVSSLQLYVHRVLMNLEFSSDWDGKVPPEQKTGVYAHFKEPAKRNEWQWREHYRVWEANRRVFLYPENYIEPELRDDKTPLFDELEATLLQQEISETNVHDAYSRYLTGFDEVACLQIAGAYYDDSEKKTLHLFGVTQDAPPVYYYRAIDESKPAASRISAWQKLNLQIPVRKVSPILFLGRLYVFWLETATRPLTTFTSGNSTFGGYRHAVRIKYSTLRPDGTWTPPQSLSFSSGATTEESRVVNDPKIGQDQKDAIDQQIRALEKQEKDLEGAIGTPEMAGTAAGEVKRTQLEKSTAQGALTQPASLQDEVDALGTALLAVAAATRVVVGDVAAAGAVPFAVAAAQTAATTAATGAAAEAVLAGASPAAAALAGARAAAKTAVDFAVTAAWTPAARLAVLSALALALRMPPVPLSDLFAAGVAINDKLYLARRRIVLLNATNIANIAALNLAGLSGALKGVRASLRNLREKQIRVSVRWDRSGRDHTEPLDNYRPEGWEWDRVYPDVYSLPNAPGTEVIRLMLVPRNEPEWSPGAMRLRSNDLDLPWGILREITAGDAAIPSMVTNWSFGVIQSVSVPPFPMYAGQMFYGASFWLNRPALSGAGVAIAPATSDVQVVNGKPDSFIIEFQGDSVWMRKLGTSYVATRLGTTLTPALTAAFWRNGAASLLDAEFQVGPSMAEVPSKIRSIVGQNNFETQSPFHPDNPCRTYFRETFFHIPSLVANHLNSQQHFAAAQSWYHHIFDPTSPDREAWRYRELRELPKTPASLREMLTEPNALLAYRDDPFNPHAIARTRLSAYQKSIVMKYIDNLLDWGDSLFTQFTMESINEATMLYVMAQDILGARPRTLGSCGEGKVSPKKTYENIEPGLTEVSEFLVELEAPRKSVEVYGAKGEALKLVIETRPMSTQASRVASAAPSLPGAATPGGLPGSGSLAVQTPLVMRELRGGGAQYWTSAGGTSLERLYDTGDNGSNGPPVLGSGPNGGLPPIPGSKTGNIDFVKPDGGVAGGRLGVRDGEKIETFGGLVDKYGLDRELPHDPRGGYPPDAILFDPGHEVASREPVPVLAVIPPKNAVFCIPPNKDLLAYWSRVEDRLFKIRNCMDISGVRRRLDLFSPEIDPRLLVRIKEAGLSLDEVLNSTSGNLPPYRFSYLIDKAKQYAGTLQSFGAQLLSALEKRDGEELSHLRTVHEQNLLTMRTKMMQMEIDAAEDTIEGLRRQKLAVEYRQSHFDLLSQVGQIAGERKQQELQKEAAGYRALAGIAQVVGSVLSIIPDVGAPTAMKFGGSQLGASGRALADGLNAVAAFHDTSASMAGVEASNQRRDQEWKHQVELAKREIDQLDKNITAAGFRRDIALRSREVHDQTIEQTEELFDLFREKFSNLERYRFLSKELRQLYRLAFNSVLSMARMAEQAYRAERTEDDGLLSGNYWDAESAGLLAGEKLLIELQGLEQRYIETNYRELELEQSFSLAQFQPNQLATLRLTGACEFTVPEWFFDLFYPGQYRRRLKAVRVTIPCVTGPYGNIGATLRLVYCWIRLSKLPLPLPGDPRPVALDPPKPVPLRHTVAIATSKAQYDAGVFDFNFRDERYMPFEGAGAISTWQVSLPKSVRVFDYGTISDVILHLSYTAEHDEGLRQWHDDHAELIKLLRLETAPPRLTRAFSLRNEFPDAFHRLLTSKLHTEIDFIIDSRHFPLFLAGAELQATTASLYVISSLSKPQLQGTTLAVGMKAATPALQGFKCVGAPPDPSAGDTGGGMTEFYFGDVLAPTPGATGVSKTLLGVYLIKLTALAPKPPGSGEGTIDPQALHDIIVKVGYRLAPPAP